MINTVRSTGADLLLRGMPTIRERGSVEGKSAKSLGETPPVVLNLAQIGSLAALFGKSGFLSRLKRRLNYLKKKKCTIVPAKGTTACVDDNDIVYIGVDFLKDCLEKEDGKETIAGVMAHEWGHACALKPAKDEIQELNWNQIFELRRAHETLADETSGRMLYRMGYSTDGIIGFLTRKGKDTHNLKYHAPEIRAQVIEYGFAAEKRKADLARSLFPKSSYSNEYDSILLDIA